MHPPKIARKCRFPSDENLMCNFNSGNGLTDPKSVSQDTKLILNVLEINKIWVKPFFFRPPSSSQPKNSFLARTVSFFGGFFKERYEIAQEDLLLQMRHVPNVSETSTLYSPPLLTTSFYDILKLNQKILTKKKVISKISVDSNFTFTRNFTFTSYAMHDYLYWHCSIDYCVKLKAYMYSMISNRALWKFW